MPSTSTSHRYHLKLKLSHSSFKDVPAKWTFCEKRATDIEKNFTNQHAKTNPISNAMESVRTKGRSGEKLIPREIHLTFFFLPSHHRWLLGIRRRPLLRRPVRPTDHCGKSPLFFSVHSQGSFSFTLPQKAFRCKEYIFVQCGSSFFRLNWLQKDKPDAWRWFKAEQKPLKNPDQTSRM